MLFTNGNLNSFVKDYINIKQTDLKTYRDQFNRLRDNLADYINQNPEFGLVKMLNSGSVAKGTALKTINDMDVAVYVKAQSVGSDGESDILNYVHKALIEIYSRYNMKEDQFSIGQHCVKVSFKGSGLDVDVVPVIPNGEPNDQGHMINKDTGERVLTSIPLHLEFIRNRKDKHPNYSTMVRIIKWWRNKRDFKLKSFLIELIWAHIADTEGISDDITNSLQQFFRYIIETNLESPIVFDDYHDKSKFTVGSDGCYIFDPVNPQNNVGVSLDDTKRNRIIEEAEEALGFLSNAIQASTKGTAVSRLQQIFGPSFSF